MRLIHLIYFVRQGEDEADWAYEEEPAEKEVAVNFLLKEFCTFPTRLPPSKLVRK